MSSSSSSSSTSSPSSSSSSPRAPAPANGDGPAKPPPRSPEHARLHASFQDDRHYLEKMVALDADARGERVDALLALKGSIDKSSAAIQSHNAQRHRKRDTVEQQETRRFDELLSQGNNPYEAARTRRVRETADAERAAIERRIQDKQVAILRHLEVEKVWTQRQERVAAEHTAYEKKYQQEMGRAAVEERTRQYLVARTGRDTMDPAGKAFRLYPSQETTIKDRSFGLGKSLVHDAEQRHAVVDKVHRKRAHRGAAAAEPSVMLLPRYGREDESSNTTNNAAERARSPSVATRVPAAVVPGQELQSLHHSPSSLPPVARSSSSASEDSARTTKKTGFGRPHRSVLEQRMLAQAREKQRTNVFQKQIVWGKEFTGRAFLADPPELWFQDFDVGVPMTLSVTVTNVSHTFNQFKLLALDESIREFFEVAYDKPGRMSAGMACRIAVTFTAVRARDLTSVVPAVAQTGAFSIPLRCTCKKAVPVMETRALVFKGVVAGEKQTRTLKLENRGALPLAFRVRGLRRRTSWTRDDAAASGPEMDEEDDSGDLPGALADTRIQEAELLDGTPPIEPTQLPADAGGGPPTAQEEDAAAQSNTNEMGEEEENELQPAAGSPTSLSASASTASSLRRHYHAPAILSEREPLSQDEQRILDLARASTQYKPEGADTPIRHTLQGTVAPYSSTSIAFTFAPASPVEIDDEPFAIEFPEAATTFRTALWSAQLLAAVRVSVAASATHVPIVVERPELDFRCCLLDRLYRQQLVVCNRGSVALKMQVRVPKALEGCVEFHPNMGFVQAAATSVSATEASHHAGRFPVQIKFRPNKEMWRRLEAKGFGGRALGFLAVPVQIVVPDQVVPVFVILRARISSAALAFSLTKLDFGACALGHSAAHTLVVTNASRLPQRIAFVKLPPELRLENAQSTANAADDGVATLLPDEAKPFRVVYQPNASATSLASRLVCRTTTNDEYVLHATGECVASPLAFSHSVVQLAATQLGQRQTHSIVCTNNSDKAQTLELVVPKEAEHVLRVTPTVATIAARASVRVEIEFLADDSVFAIAASEFSVVWNDAASLRTMPAHSVTVSASKGDATPLANELKATVQAVAPGAPWVESNGVAGEERSVHHTWTVLAFRQQQQQQRQRQRDAAVVAFQVRTTVVEAKLIATPKDLEFGQVAIGQTLVRELRFTNHSACDVVLRAQALHALGGFIMVNSLQRVVAARGGERVVKMAFTPTAALRYDDELELACAELGVVRVALRGEGVSPSLCLQPADGVIDFKDVLARNRATSELQLTNASAFPLTLAIVPLPEEDDAVTSGGLPVFTFSPSEATIPAQTTLVVKVQFAPDHQRPQHYHRKFLIQVPNESERHVVSLSGRCWENQLYVFNPLEPAKLFAAPSVEDLLDVPPSINLTSLFSGGVSSLLSAALAATGIKKAAAPLTVVFDGESGVASAEAKTIFVGATLPLVTDDSSCSDAAPKAAAGAAVGSFEFAIEENTDKPQYAKLFTLEPMKGTVSAAQQLPVAITYQKPVSSAVTAAASSTGGDESRTRPDLVVSQWIQVRVTCTLRGGALWRLIPAAGGSTQPATASATGKSAGASTAAGTAAAAASGGGDSDARTVQLVLRAKMDT